MNQIAQIIPGENADGAAKRRFTVDEFLAMGMAGIFGPDERVELLAGEIYVMSPAGRFHEVLRTELAHFWGRRAPDHLMAVEEMQLRLTDTYQPRIDIGVYSRPLLAPDARGPDMLLVVEIADSSLKIDTGLKAQAYASAGVREYWVINAQTRLTTLHREPRSDGSYAVIFDAAADVLATPLLVPELAIRLCDLPGA
jgi:Uma2 family endonuclease